MTRSTNNRNTPKRRAGTAGTGRRDHLLDVRVRRSTAKRQRRRRVLGTVVGVTFWIALAVGAVFGFNTVVNKFFLQNPEYNLRVVDAELDDLMSRDEAMRMAGLSLGTNIFRVDLAAAEHAFQQIDQIENVTIQRDWPDKITIKLTKRIPIAWLARADASNLAADHTLLLDANGHTMKPYRIEPDYWRLPVIYASDPDLIQQGDILAVADLQAALDLLAARAKRPGSLLEISSIDITKGYALDVIDADKAHFIFAPQDAGAQLDRLEKLLVNCRDNNRQLESVNLIPKKYTPVRFQLVAAAGVKPVDDRTTEDSH
jgi:cell division septal protein FtsQ